MAATQAITLKGSADIVAEFFGKYNVRRAHTQIMPLIVFFTRGAFTHLKSLSEQRSIPFHCSSQRTGDLEIIWIRLSHK